MPCHAMLCHAMLCQMNLEIIVGMYYHIMHAMNDSMRNSYVHI
jgi:hypothetical protein